MKRLSAFALPLLLAHVARCARTRRRGPTSRCKLMLSQPAGLGPRRRRAPARRPPGEGLGPGGRDRQQAGRPERDRRAGGGALAAPTATPSTSRPRRRWSPTRYLFKTLPYDPQKDFVPVGVRRQEPVRDPGARGLADQDRSTTWSRRRKAEPGKLDARQRRAEDLRRHDRAPVRGAREDRAQPRAVRRRRRRRCRTCSAATSMPWSPTSPRPRSW